jgi:hypothetical protein
MTTLIDTVRIATEPRPLERSFEVESRGGYARTVVGRLAYFDEEAQTYMVLTRDGVLIRVPLRDITSSRGVSRKGPIVADVLSKISRIRTRQPFRPLRPLARRATRAPCASSDSGGPLMGPND